MLTHYPNARVRVLVVAPERARHYKFADTLSYTLFDKYQKRGYDVEVDIIGERTNLGSGPGRWIGLCVCADAILLLGSLTLDPLSPHPRGQVLPGSSAARREGLSGVDGHAVLRPGEARSTG